MLIYCSSEKQSGTGKRCWFIVRLSAVVICAALLFGKVQWSVVL